MPHSHKERILQALTLSLVMGTGVLLGMGNPLARLASADGLHILAFTLWPTAVAGLLLASIGLARHGPSSLGRRLAGFGLVAGAFGHALPMLAAYWLAAHAGAGFASLSFTLTPVLTLALMALLGREKLRPVRLAAVGLGMAGGLLLVGGQVWSAELDASFIAVALLVPASIAATNVYRGLHMPRDLPDAWLSAATLVGSTALLAALAPMVQDGPVLLTGTHGTVWLMLQTASLVAGYLCYFALQRRAEPVAFSLIGYVMMLVSVGIGVSFFGETVAWTLWPAVLLIGSALWLIHRFPAEGNA
jgi:drug/metabolite transporter (DMT)-like permease